MTDIGYSNEKDIVWETLSNIEGDSSLVDSQFKTVSSAGRTENPTASLAEPETEMVAGQTHTTTDVPPQSYTERLSQEKLEYVGIPSFDDIAYNSISISI